MIYSFKKSSKSLQIKEKKFKLKKYIKCYAMTGSNTMIQTKSIIIQME